jgi:hypothetical protein
MLWTWDLVHCRSGANITIVPVYALRYDGKAERAFDPVLMLSKAWPAQPPQKSRLREASDPRYQCFRYDDLVVL